MKFSFILTPRREKDKTSSDGSYRHIDMGRFVLYKWPQKTGREGMRRAFSSQAAGNLLPIIFAGYLQ